MEYQVAHDAHAAAKAAVKAIEPQLMAVAGAPPLCPRLSRPSPSSPRPVAVLPRTPLSPSHSLSTSQAAPPWTRSSSSATRTS